MLQAPSPMLVTVKLHSFPFRIFAFSSIIGTTALSNQRSVSLVLMTQLLHYKDFSIVNTGDVNSGVHSFD